MSPSPTIGERLAIAKAKRLHVSDIKDPMVRLLWWHHWQWRHEEIFAEARKLQSEFGALMDAAEIEIEVARAERVKIIRHRDALRTWAGRKAA